MNIILKIMQTKLYLTIDEIYTIIKALCEYSKHTRNKKEITNIINIIRYGNKKIYQFWRLNKHL